MYCGKLIRSPRPCFKTKVQTRGHYHRVKFGWERLTLSRDIGDLKSRKRSFYVSRLYILSTYTGVSDFKMPGYDIGSTTHDSESCQVCFVDCSCIFRIRHRAKCVFVYYGCLICSNVYTVVMKTMKTRISATAPDKVMVKTPKWPQYPSL